MPQSRLSQRLGRTAVCNGYTYLHLDLHVQDVIGSAWKGRGPCIVVNDLRPRGDTPEEFERAFLGTAVHELAHIVLRPRPCQEWPTATKAEVEADAQRVVEHVSSQKRIWDLPVPWQQHDVFFIRAALHLRHRADRAGVLLAPSQLCAGDRFGLSAGLAYDRALGGEPAEMLDATFQGIRRHQPPSEFLHLWIDTLAVGNPTPRRRTDEPDQSVREDRRQAASAREGEVRRLPRSRGPHRPREGAGPRHG